MGKRENFILSDVRVQEKVKEFQNLFISRIGSQSVMIDWLKLI